jgi:hypothetical protein
MFLNLSFKLSNATISLSMVIFSSVPSAKSILSKSMTLLRLLSLLVSSASSFDNIAKIIAVIDIHNDTVAKVFGLSGKSITAILPTDIDKISLTNDDSGDYAMILAMLSKLEAEDTSAIANQVFDW